MSFSPLCVEFPSLFVHLAHSMKWGKQTCAHVTEGLYYCACTQGGSCWDSHEAYLSSLLSTFSWPCFSCILNTEEKLHICTILGREDSGLRYRGGLRYFSSGVIWDGPGAWNTYIATPDLWAPASLLYLTLQDQLCGLLQWWGQWVTHTLCSLEHKLHLSSR